MHIALTQVVMNLIVIAFLVYKLLVELYVAIIKLLDTDNDGKVRAVQKGCRPELKHQTLRGDVDPGH
jgi:hypothetical protein